MMMMMMMKIFAAVKYVLTNKSTLNMRTYDVTCNFKIVFRIAVETWLELCSWE